VRACQHTLPQHREERCAAPHHAMLHRAVCVCTCVRVHVCACVCNRHGTLTACSC
jgi:hypothetical protein